MSANKKSDLKLHPYGFFIRIHGEKKKKSLFCQICKFILRTSSDFSSFDELGCCHTCNLKWAEGNLEKHKNGWRPGRQEVLSEISNRRKMSLSFEV